MTQTLSQLENRGAFIERHIGPDAQQQQEMLKTVGADSLNALIGQIVPKDIQLATPPQVGEATTEFAALAELKAIAGLNKRYKSYIGMGYTNVQLPPVILRNMLENPGWYTAYTPYQPEVSQGRLEALLNFQQVTLDLTGMDIASASLLDEATAAAEAMAMAKRVSKLKNANRFFVAADVHPQTLDVVRTRAETFGFDVIVDDADKVLDHQDVFGVLLQQVGTTGEVHDYGALIAELKNGEIEQYEFHPQSLGFELCSAHDLRADSAEQSKAMLLAVLDNQAGPARDIVLLNAAAALYVSGVATSLADGVARARDVLASGAAKQRLQALVDLSQSLAPRPA
mgnify:CR=1 FL=1